jgi:hypothetical protein
VIRGKGMQNTRLVVSPSGYGNREVIFFDNGYDIGWDNHAGVNLDTLTKDSTNITTLAPHGLVPGDEFVIDMLTNTNSVPAFESKCGWCGRESGTRVVGQLGEVLAAPSPTTLQINPPLYWAYDQTPQITKLDGWIEWAGIEGLTIDTTLVANDAAKYAIMMQGAKNCWVYDVEIRGVYERGVWSYGSLFCSVLHSYVHGNRPIGVDGSLQYQSSRAYGIFLGPHTTATEISDNMFNKLTLAVAFEGCSSGNVLGYNFGTNFWWAYLTDWPIRFAFLSHGPHPLMNLFEGNWSAGRIRCDNIFGSNSHWTHLRNFYFQFDRRPNNIGNYSQSQTVDLEWFSHCHNFVGNILGTTGWENLYDRTAVDALYENGPRVVYALGYPYGGYSASPTDTNVLFSLLRWGNWSSVTNNILTNSPGQVWHTNNVQDIGDFSIPTSYYLSGTNAPIWWNPALEFPPYDPADPTNNSPLRIPAGNRFYQGLTGGAGSGANTPNRDILRFQRKR